MIYKILYWFGFLTFVFFLVIFNVPDYLSYPAICILTSFYYIIFWGSDDYD